MIFLRQKTYADLIAESALARALAARVVALEERTDKLLDTILALKQAGAELPPGHGEPGFDKYTFDEIEEEAMGDDLPPSPRPPDEMDPDDILDIARALGYKH
jgi:hypothetical protein